MVDQPRCWLFGAEPELECPACSHGAGADILNATCLACAACSDVTTSCPSRRSRSQPAGRYFRRNRTWPPRGFVCQNLRINLRCVRPRICPRVYQVPQHAAMDMRPTVPVRSFPAGAPVPAATPYTRPDNAGFSAAHLRARVDPRKRLTQLLDHPFQNLCLLARRKRGQQLFEIAQIRHVS